MLRQLLEDAHTVIKLTAVSSEQEPHSTLAAFLMNPRGRLRLDPRRRLAHLPLPRRPARQAHRATTPTCRCWSTAAKSTRTRPACHPQGNILLGCLGMKSTPPPGRRPPDSAPEAPGDVLMACSDGLWHYFSPDGDGRTCWLRQPPRDAVEIAGRRSAPPAPTARGDNISIAVLKLEVRCRSPR